MTSKFLHGMHDPGGEHLMADKPGWILFTEELGHSPQDMSSKDYSSWTNAGFTPIVRLNNGYGSAGTIPEPSEYSNFAQRCANFVRFSSGNRHWIVGNEPNHSQERPNGIAILPQEYARCYQQVRTAIKSIPGHGSDLVLVAAVAPWNIETGPWYEYWVQVLKLVRMQCDGITLHTYTHHHDPGTITTDIRMAPPFDRFKFEFRAYQDLMDLVPSDMRHLPCFLTEMAQVPPNGMGWWNGPNTWIERAVGEIDHWNRKETNQKILSAIAYRWPRYDPWYIQGKEEVERDFERAAQRGFPSPIPLPVQALPTTPPPENIIQLPFVGSHSSLDRDWFLTAMARVFGFEVRVLEAILKVESSGRAFENSRVIIRFENHEFASQIGRLAPDRLDQVLQLFQWGNPTYTGHQWRRSTQESWIECHRNGQAGEWEVFEFASTIHPEAAAQSISMGAAQVMGFNHRKLGYPSAVEMLRDFGNRSTGEMNQLVGMFAFFNNTYTLVEAIRSKNWRRIALLYNGSGNVDYYANLLEQAYLEN